MTEQDLQVFEAGCKGQLLGRPTPFAATQDMLLLIQECRRLRKLLTDNKIPVGDEPQLTYKNCGIDGHHTDCNCNGRARRFRT